MSNGNELIEILARLAALMRVGQDENWAKAFEALRNEAEVSPDLARDKIRGIFGGMGSFNDVVLYRNGQPLVPENNELTVLRNKLYGLCQRGISLVLLRQKE